MIYDPGLKYELSEFLREADIARDPALLRRAREALVAELADYPGVLTWREEIRDGILLITATKYPPEYAARVIERRRRAALRGEDAA